MDGEPGVTDWAAQPGIRIKCRGQCERLARDHRHRDHRQVTAWLQNEVIRISPAPHSSDAS